MSLYNNKYRIESARCSTWDYTSNGYYFVTINTYKHQYFFGNIIAGKMKLSIVGKIVAEEWQKTPQIRHNVQLDEWIVMPNHLHGIIIINNPVETFRRNVSTKNQPILKPNSLGSIIGQFKSVCTKQIRQQGFTNFRWQTRFYDHIIRDKASLQRIRQYIVDNPAKWELDRNYPQNNHRTTENRSL